MINETINRILSSIVLISIALFFIVKGSFLFNFFIFICFFVAVYEWHQMNKKKTYFYFGSLFLILSFISVYLVRNHISDDESICLVIFLFVLLTCVGTDIGGYLFGKIFKGPKLIKISPNKTYAGMLGGFFLSIIFVYLILNNASFFGFEADYRIDQKNFIRILVISLTSQIGDLIISYFKRLSKVKNTGKIIPGHGGILDRIDGMIFAFPISYIIFQI